MPNLRRTIQHAAQCEFHQILRRGSAADGELRHMATPVPQHPLPRGRPSGGTQPVSSRRVEVAPGRLSREMKEMMLNPADGCQVEMVGDDKHHWLATILGPTDTPYEGGHFKLNLVFPKSYPHRPPTVTFATQIYHCNISNNGDICMDILEDEWSPVLTAEKILLSIRSLLAEPNPEDPVDTDIGELYRKNRQQYDTNARDWTTRYAT